MFAEVFFLVSLLNIIHSLNHVTSLTFTVLRMEWLGDLPVVNPMFPQEGRHTGLEHDIMWS